MLRSLDEALEWRSGLDGELVFTNGVFELLHPGHIDCLTRARALGDYLIVAINSDSSASKLGKGAGRPFVTQDDRARVVDSLEVVDCVLIFDDATPVRVIRALRPDVLVKGGDYDEQSMPGADIVKGYGGRVKAVDFKTGYSTSNLIRRIRGAS